VTPQEGNGAIAGAAVHRHSLEALRAGLAFDGVQDLVETVPGI
jgi:hypothetical protein